jgi:DNA-binding beta-propeller fold protein YncE
LGLNFASNQLGVTIGGRAASNVSCFSTAAAPDGAPICSLTATVPPGTQGNADINVTTPIGNATVPGGFSYVMRSDFDLPSTAAPFEMILDKSRNRLLWTDTSTNQVVVYSLTTGQIEQTIAVGNTPAGLSLTPDGSDLLVVDSGDSMLNVYDANSLTLIQQASTPVPSIPLTITPVWVTAVANGKAFLLDTEDGYGGIPIYEYDIASNTFTQAGINGDQSSFSAASADGSTAFVGGEIWNASTNQFVPAYLSEDFSRALSSDGYAITEFLALYGKNGTVNGIAGMHYAMEDELDFNSVYGQKLNSTGSLSYLPETDRIRIVDVRHGQLLRTIMVPDGLNREAVEGMAIDPDGQTIYVLTQTGVTTLQFASDPLSIGEVQASGDQLTILGSGFASGATVEVDGVSAAVTVQNSQQILATVPSLSSGPHQIVVTLPSGESYSLDNALDISSSTSSTSSVQIARPFANPLAAAAPTHAPPISLWQRLRLNPARRQTNGQGLHF